MDLVGSDDSEFKTPLIQEDAEEPNNKDTIDIPNEILDFLYNQQNQINNSNDNNTEVIETEGSDRFKTRCTIKLTYIAKNDPE